MSKFALFGVLTYFITTYSILVLLTHYLFTIFDNLTEHLATSLSVSVVCAASTRVNGVISVQSTIIAVMHEQMSIHSSLSYCFTYNSSKELFSSGLQHPSLKYIQQSVLNLPLSSLVSSGLE